MAAPPPMPDTGKIDHLSTERGASNQTVHVQDESQKESGVQKHPDATVIENEEEKEHEKESEEEDEDDEEGTYDHPMMLKNFADKFARESMKVRVHDIKIEGQTKIKDWVIEVLLKDVKNATTLQELLEESAKANTMIENMGVFDKCVIRLDAGPPELPGTANVIVDLKEKKNPVSFDVGVYSRPETKNRTFEGTLKWKNLLGYGETWDGTGCYGWNATSEMSIGAQFPILKSVPLGLISRASLLTQDWDKYSSYKERLVGLSLGLVNQKNNELSYNFTWRDLKDPTRRASPAIRSQLGHTLLSSLKYTYKIDHRDSGSRPTRGYAFSSTTQLAGLGPDDRLLRFGRQELDLRFALPLGFYKTALNFGVSAGLILPWGKDFLGTPTPISDRFFMGGYSSLVGDLKGPSSLLGFRTRGVGPSDARRQIAESEQQDTIGIGRDALGGDLAVTAFADLSFDLPFQFLRDHDIHGHTFICAGNLVGLTGEGRKPFDISNFASSLRCSVGAGLVIPTRILRIEVNYCKNLRHQTQDRIKEGIQFCFSFSQ